jgi:hypothetical protein
MNHVFRTLKTHGELPALEFSGPSEQKWPWAWMKRMVPGSQLAAEKMIFRDEFMVLSGDFYRD